MLGTPLRLIVLPELINILPRLVAAAGRFSASIVAESVALLREAEVLKFIANYRKQPNLL